MRSGILGVLAAIFVALLPFMTSQDLFSGGVNAKYFFIVSFSSLLILIAAYLIYSGERAFSFRHRWLLCVTASVLLVYYIAAFAGVFPERSLWSDILRSSGVFFLTHITLIAFLLGELLTARGWSIVRRSVAISAGVFSLISIFGSEGFGVLGKFLWLDLNISGLTFGNSTFAGAYLVLALILALIELSRIKENVRWKVALIASVVLIVFSPTLFNIGSFSAPTSFLGSARSSSATVWLLLIFLGGSILLRRYIHESLKKRTMRIWSLAWLAAIFVGIALLFTLGSFIQEKYVENSTAARIIVWESALEAVKERPILGYGSENFEQAIQKHFDNRLYLKENIGETWFDRAHNVLIDTLIDVGIVGVLAILILIACFYSIIFRARGRGLIEEAEVVLLSALPVAHILQLQTSFDTVGTYAIVGIIGGYALWLERGIVKGNWKEDQPHPQLLNKAAAILLVVVALVSLKFLVFDEYGRQIALMAILRTTNTAKQNMYIEESLSRTSSFSSLRFSAASFIKGALEHIAQNGGRDNDIILKRLSLYEDYYNSYLNEAPLHYRARMNYAYLLLIKTALGEDRTKDTKSLLRNSYVLSPNNPLTYALDAVTSLYAGRVAEAKTIMRGGVALNPNAVFSQIVLAYIEEQERRLPSVTILKLENL